MAEPDELQLSPQQLELLSGDEEVNIMPSYNMGTLHLISVRSHRLLTLRCLFFSSLRFFIAQEPRIHAIQENCKDLDCMHAATLSSSPNIFIKISINKWNELAMFS